MTGREMTGSDPRLRRARIATLASLGTALLSSLTMPAVGLFFETSGLWVVLGTVGVVVFTAAQAGVLYAVVTPWLTEAVHRRLLVLFAAASVSSVPLLGPVGDGRWPTWAWVGSSIVGSAPLVARRRLAVVTTIAAVAVALGIASSTGGSFGVPVVVTLGVGLSIAAVCGLPVWLWGLLTEAQAGRAAQARLAVTEERLRFAREVHDLLGHSLSVIALKAELAARLAPVDAGRAGQEAAEVRRLAASALADMRAAVHGYRTVNLRKQLVAIEQVLRSSGVRCTIVQPAEDVPSEIAAQLAPVLREACTNMLRHSKATRCSIEITGDGNEVRLTVVNDGASGGGPDDHSHGLRGLAERLADARGRLRTHEENGVFTLEATVRTSP